jgi:hypothetical protein
VASKGGRPSIVPLWRDTGTFAGITALLMRGGTFPLSELCQKGVSRTERSGVFIAVSTQPPGTESQSPDFTSWPVPGSPVPITDRVELESFVLHSVPELVKVAEYRDKLFQKRTALGRC